MFIRIICTFFHVDGTLTFLRVVFETRLTSNEIFTITCCVHDSEIIY